MEKDSDEEKQKYRDDTIRCSDTIRVKEAFEREPKAKRSDSLKGKRVNKFLITHDPIYRAV